MYFERVTTWGRTTEVVTAPAILRAAELARLLRVVSAVAFVLLLLPLRLGVDVFLVGIS